MEWKFLIFSFTDAVKNTASDTSVRNLKISKFFEVLPSPASLSWDLQCSLNSELQNRVLLLLKRPKGIFLHGRKTG